MKCGPGNYLHHYLHAHWDFSFTPLPSLSIPQSAIASLHKICSWILFMKSENHTQCILLNSVCSCECHSPKFQPSVHACAHERAQTLLQSIMNAEKVIIQSQEHIFDNNNNNNRVLLASMPTCQQNTISVCCITGFTYILVRWWHRSFQLKQQQQQQQ